MKLNSSSKQKGNKNISLTWFRDRKVHDQDDTNRTADKNSIDQLSYNSLRHDSKCGRCDETYPDQNMFNHHSTKLHRSNLELISEINDKYENMAIIPCEVAEKGVKVKTGEEFIEHEYLVLSKVTCDKCETNPAFESALKLQNNMHHKDDESTSSRDVIRSMNNEQTI